MVGRKLRDVGQAPPNKIGFEMMKGTKKDIMLIFEYVKVKSHILKLMEVEMISWVI
jgi:hypothetical protein